MYYLYSLLISLFTLYYASFASFREENFTGIANNLNHQFLFRIWVLSTSVFFFTMTLRLFKKHQWQPQYLKPSAFAIMILINLAPYIPYKESFIHLNALHVICAMGASVLYLLLLQLFIFDCRILDTDLNKKIEPVFKMIVFSLLVLLLTYGNINSFIEVVLVCALSFFIAYANQ